MVFVLSSSSTLVEPLFTPIIIPSMLEALDTHDSPGGMACTLPAMRRVMSAAISRSRQSHRGLVMPTRLAAALPCFLMTSAMRSATMSTACA